MNSKPPKSSEPEGLPGWLSTIGVSLFLARFLMPTEATDQGITLWIACGWMLFACIAGYVLWREERPLLIRISWIDLCVGTFLGGHLLAGLVALCGQSHQRATINFFWEWVGLLFTYLFLRSLVSHRQLKSQLLAALVLLATFLSGLGVWQHYVWYPNQAAKVRHLLELHESASSGQKLSTSERSEYESLYEEFGPSLFSQNEEGRQLLLSRITESTEALGFFALANTLGGVLAAMLILLAALWFQQTHRKSQILFGLLIVTVTFGLFLTKNLTGWVGAICGISLLGGRMILAGRIRVQRLAWSLGILACSALVLGVVAFASGGLDAQILDVAPSSLRYRLEYWIATWNMIQGNLWLGVGSGNFREHYFLYKLPGASEEILDPHNLWLETWANGGLLGLAGLLGMFVIACANWVKELQIGEGTKTTGRLWIAGLVSPAMVWLGSFVSGFPITTSLIAVPVYWLIANSTMNWWTTDQIPRWDVPGYAYAAAFLGMVVHLNGAGGIGMPAIVSLLFWLLLSSYMSLKPMYTADWQDRWHLVGAGIALVCLVGAIGTALVPATGAENLMQRAHQRSISSGLRTALPVLEEATEVDPLSTDAWHQLALARFAIWESQPGNDQAFDQAMSAMDTAISLNPRNPKLHHQKGTWWLRYLKHHADKIESAQKALAIAADLYPNSSIIRADYAVALAQAGDPDAVAEARQAIMLDDLNIQNGHRDKFLEPAVRDRLQQIATEAN